MSASLTALARYVLCHCRPLAQTQLSRSETVETALRFDVELRCDLQLLETLCKAILFLFLSRCSFLSTRQASLQNVLSLSSLSNASHAHQK